MKRHYAMPFRMKDCHTRIFLGRSAKVSLLSTPLATACITQSDLEVTAKEENVLSAFVDER